MYFDTHFHLNDKQYKKIDHSKIIADCKKNDVVGIINVSASYFESNIVVNQSKKYDFMYASIGVHPSEVDKFKKEDILRLEEIISKNPKKVVAIGECGLDYYYPHYPSKEIQKKWFIKQIELAIKHDLALIVHSRNAAKDTIDILKKYKPPRVIIHCFTYDEKIAQEFVKIGCYISFSGIVTFKKKVDDIKKAAKIVPLDKLLCETDGPLLTPEPFRGKTNFPQLIKYTYQQLEIIRGEKINDVVLKNVKKVFKI